MSGYNTPWTGSQGCDEGGWLSLLCVRKCGSENSSTLLASGRLAGRISQSLLSRMTGRPTRWVAGTLV